MLIGSAVFAQLTAQIAAFNTRKIKKPRKGADDHHSQRARRVATYRNDSHKLLASEIKRSGF